MLIARPNATILYATLAKGPKLPPEHQMNSTRHFMRELNVGLRTHWFDVTGSTLTNSVLMPVNPGDSSVFYRLVCP